MRNCTKRKFLMLALLFASVSRDASNKRAELIKKSGLFHSFGEDNFWAPLKVPSDLAVVSFGNNVTVSADVDFVTHDELHRLFNGGGGI